MNPLITVENLTLEKAGRPILENIHLEIERGDYIGLLGPNGAGKSTLLHALIGMEKPTHGKVHSVPMTIGFVPQHFAIENFHLPLTVSELIRTGLKDCRDSGALKKVQDVLRQMEMEKFIDRNLQDLSVGERQKILFARAIVDKPDLLLLDEPMSALDDPSRARFYEQLKALNDDGVAILMVSHDVDLVVQHVKRVLCLNRSLNLACHTMNMEADDIKKLFAGHYQIHHHDHV